MKLAKYNPFQILNKDYRSDINQIFDQYFPITSTWDGNGFWPEVDIEDNKKNYIVTVNIPGVDPKSVEIFYNNANLTIKCESSSVEKEEGKNYIRVERSAGAFCRTFSLPDVDDTKIDAHHKNGVLTITLPKSETSITKKIEVKTSD